jgi:hypothetical protein
MMSSDERTHTAPYDAIDLLCIFLAAALPWFIPLAIAQYFLRRSKTVRSDMAALVEWAAGHDLLPAAHRPQLAQPDQGASDQAASDQGADLLATLHDALHVLVIGHTRGGKTSLMHELARRWAAQQRRVLVCDPDAAPGLWPGCRVAGGGDDYPAIASTVESVRALVEQRRQQRAAGRRQFAPLYLVIDEAHDVVREVDAAHDLIKSLLLRGGKIGVHLVIGVHNRQVGMLRFEGASKMLQNFEYTVSVRKLPDGRRRASIETTEGTHELPMPILPDPDSYITQDNTSVTPPDNALLTALLSQRNEPLQGVITQGNASVTQGARNVTGNATVTDDTIRKWAREGRSKRAIAQHLTGTMQARLARIDRALAEDAPPGAFRFLGEGEGEQHAD